MEEDRKPLPFPFRETGLDGVLHALAFTNLYSGKDSWGDKIIDRTMYRSGPVDNQLRFLTGLAAGVASEFAAPIYLAAATDLPWYYILTLDVAVKTIPRAINYFFRKSKNRSHRQITST